MSLFGTKTLTAWHDRGITDVSITLIDKWCAGKKVSVQEKKEKGYVLLETTEGITISGDPLYADFLKTARLTLVGSKWILASEGVNTRCGCGSSFSIRSNNPLEDKIARTKLAMKQKKEGVHH